MWPTADCLTLAVDLADPSPARAVGLDIPELIKPEEEITQRAPRTGAVRDLAVGSVPPQVTPISINVCCRPASSRRT
jgi:hypothetical protein